MMSGRGNLSGHSPAPAPAQENFTEAVEGFLEVANGLRDGGWTHKMIIKALLAAAGNVEGHGLAQEKSQGKAKAIRNDAMMRAHLLQRVMAHGAEMVGMIKTNNGLAVPYATAEQAENEKLN